MKNNDIIEDVCAILARNHHLSLLDIVALKRSFNNREDISFEDFLLEQGLVDKANLLQAMSEHYKVPALDVIGEFFDHYLLSLFPKDILLLHYFIPYTREGDLLTVVAAEPNDPHLPVVISQYITHNISFMVGIAQDIHETIEEFYDTSDTYQPNDLDNQRMERSQMEVHPLGEDNAYNDPNQEIPLTIEETIDDYERK